MRRTQSYHLFSIFQFIIKLVKNNLDLFTYSPSDSAVNSVNRYNINRVWWQMFERFKAVVARWHLASR